MLKTRNRSQSLDDLRLSRQSKRKNLDDHHAEISQIARTEIDLSNIGSNDNENEENSPEQSHSAPVSPTHFNDKEFAAFIQCEQQQQQMISDNFVYNIDLSDTGETSHPPQSKLSIFFVSSR